MAGKFNRLITQQSDKYFHLIPFFVDDRHESSISHTTAMKTLLTALAFLCVLLGCANNDCSDVQPIPPGPVIFYFADQAGNNLVGKGNTQFQPDSVQILLDRKKVSFQKEYDPQQNGYKFIFYSGGKTSGGQLYQLYLNQSDSDSLEVLYTINQGRCFSSIEYTVFFFNGTQVYMDPQNRTIALVRNN